MLLDSGLLGDKERCGYYNRRLENRFAELLQVNHAISFNSGTAALHTALVAIGVGVGDEVIVDPLFKYSTAATMYTGAAPVYADLKASGYLIDPASVETLITKKTKAIVATASFGLSVDVVRLRKMADDYGLFLVEDCAQALLARVGDQFAGTIGHFGVFSFQSSKHINAGEGGMLITNESALLERVYATKEHGWLINKQSTNEPLGYMYRMPEAVAIIAENKLRFATQIVSFHQRVAGLFEAIADEALWLYPQKEGKNSVHVYNRWAARVADEKYFEQLAIALQETENGFEMGFCKKGLIYDRFMTRHLNTGPKEVLCPVAEKVKGLIVHQIISIDKSFKYYEKQADIFREAVRSVNRKLEVS